MPSSSSSVLLVAGSAALLAVAAYSVQPSSSTKSSRGEITDIVEYDEASNDCITAKDVCDIFDKLFLEMQSVVAQLSQHVQQIQMSGQQIPETQLRGILKAEFERALVERQAGVFEEFDVDEDCLEEATFEFLEQEEEYPNVRKAVERFQRLYENITGESVVKRRGVPEEPIEILSAEKVLEAAETYFSSLTIAMEGIIKELKAEGKDLNDKSVAQELHMKFASLANDAGEEALKEIGVTLKSFQASVEKNASNPKVGQALQMLQMKQQKDLMAMGVPAM